MVAIYVLNLSRGKYYVGMTRKNVTRVWQHIDGKGAAWTKKYPPVKDNEIQYFQEGHKESDEDKITLEYMAKYGISNVRGGSWCMVRMPRATRSKLKKKIESAKSNKSNRNRSKKKLFCTRCGRDSHSLSKCYATTHRNGTMIGTPYKHIDKATYREILEERRQLKQARLEVEDSKKDSENKQKEIERLRREISNLETAKKETNPDTMTKIIQSLSEDNFTQLATYLSAGALIAGIVAPRVLSLGLKNASNQVEYISKLLKKYWK